MVDFTANKELKILTFELTAAGGLPCPWRIAVSGEVPQLQVADGQSYDGGLVQLAGDGCRQWEHLGQLVEFVVLLPTTRSRRIPRLFLAQFQDAVERSAIMRYLLNSRRKTRINQYT